jgi:hypothetical protein
LEELDEENALLVGWSTIPGGLTRGTLVHGWNEMKEEATE